MSMETKTAPRHPPSARSVLVIDPNEEHQVLSTMALSRRGFKVTVAGTGREAMRLAVTEAFDAIVVDSKIRDLPAIDVVKALAQRMPEVPKIFVVVSGSEEAAVRALKEGASGFLVKTPRYNELLPAEVENQLEKAKVRRDLRSQGKALGESEDRFAKTFRASPLAISVTTVTEGKFIDVNDVFLAMFGYDREEMIGHTIAELRTWADPKDRERLLQALRDHGSVRDLEFRFRRKSGSTLIGAISCEMIDLEGERCVLGIVRDVTFDRRAETVRSAIYRISEATAAVRHLEEIYPIIHVVVGELMPASNFYIALREPGTDLLTFPYYVDEADTPPPPAKMGHGLTEYVLRSGEPLLVTRERFEDMVRRGEVDVVGSPSVDWLGVPLIVQGQAIGVMAVQTYSEGVRYTEEDRDLLAFVSGQVAMAIARARAEESLRRAELRFRTTFTGAPVGIALMDLEARHVETNPAYQFMLGYGPRELPGLTLESVTHAEDYPRNRQLFLELVEGSRTEYQMEKRFLRKDGTAVWGRVTASLLRDESGKPAYVIAMVEDISRQKESEDKIRAADRRYRALIENISDVVGLVNAEGLIVYVSPSTSRVLGYPPEELLGKSPMDFVHPLDMERAGKLFQHLAQTSGSTVVAEWRIRGKDGAYRWVEGNGLNLFRDPNVGAIVFTFRDITDRARALEQIRFQASLLEQVRNTVIAADLELKITYWNEYAETMYGWRAADVIGRNLLQLLTLSDPPGSVPALETSIRDIGHWEGQADAMRKDGTRLPVYVTVTSLRDSLGEPTGFVGVLVDISERVRAEAEIHARARQQAAVAELGQRALSGLELPALFDETVKVVAQTLGVTHTKILELSPEGDVLRLRAGVGWKEGFVGRATVSAGLESQAGYTLDQKEPVIVEDLRTERRFHGPPLLTDHGIISGMSVIIAGRQGPFGVLGAHTSVPRRFSVDDIYFLQAVANVLAAAIDRGRQERALAESELNASMGQLAAYVAHEINTPLTNISLLVSGIARRTQDAEIREKLEKINAQRRQAAAIIADLLSLPHHRSLDRVPHDLRQLVANAVEQVQPSRNAGVEIVLDTGDRPVIGVVDGLQIQHVILNLVRNALEATVRGRVTVRLREAPERVLLEVEDTGSGMTKEVRDQLFKPMFTTKAKGAGSGLGLSFCRAVVNGHGGTIDVVSEPGKGSTFTVTLPR